ncbi:MAG: ParB/RepB/Spo0J family partition protein [Calditrichaeota bacterium]|nr:MAG: ParB/RepB/Spo0J family partition protein [Calditrichota bacterium]
MKTKKRLGRGLQALIPADVDHSPSVDGSSASQEIEVALIEPNPFQPRIVSDDASFQELKDSIRENGILQPILVRSIGDGRYQVVAGERRFRAAVELGLRAVPVYIKDSLSDQEVMEFALVENVQRENLNPIDLAKGYQRLIEECGLTQEEVAKKIGKDRATVANVIRLLRLPRPIQESLQRGEIKEGHARALLGASDPSVQEKIWRRTVKESLSVRQVEQLVRKYQPQPPPRITKRSSSHKPAYVARLEGELREKLGTQVKIHVRREGGTVEISFYSKEDLQRLMDIFNQIKF